MTPTERAAIEAAKPPDYAPEPGWLADDVASATARLKEWGRDMTKPAREVIAETRASMGGFAAPHEGDFKAADIYLSALAAAGYVVVAREPTRAMWAKSGDALVNDKRAKQARAHHDHIGGLVWGAMFAAAEAEAKGGDDA